MSGAGEQVDDLPPCAYFDLPELELLELVVAWGIMGQSALPAGGPLLDALVAMRRRLRQLHYLRAEWERERSDPEDTPF